MAQNFNKPRVAKGGNNGNHRTTKSGNNMGENEKRFNKGQFRKKVITDNNKSVESSKAVKKQTEKRTYEYQDITFHVAGTIQRSFSGILGHPSDQKKGWSVLSKCQCVTADVYTTDNILHAVVVTAQDGRKGVITPANYIEGKSVKPMQFV